jgi:hypothetical protein
MKIELKDKPAQRGLSTAAVNHGVNRWVVNRRWACPSRPRLAAENRRNRHAQSETDKPKFLPYARKTPGYGFLRLTRRNRMRLNEPIA